MNNDPEFGKPTTQINDPGFMVKPKVSGTMNELEFVLCRDLQILKAMGPKSTYLGICGNIPYRKEKEDLLKSIMMQWPKYSGRMIYPIPDPEGISPYNIYHVTQHMWDREDPYCQLRWELLDWCINFMLDKAGIK